MATAKTEKHLVDSDGMVYIFNRLAFYNAVQAKVDKKNHVFQKDILLQISDACTVTVDAVRKWLYGDNGIGSIEAAQNAAMVLGIDYHDIVTPTEKTQEESKMNIEEMKVVQKVFGECISMIYNIEEILSQNQKPRKEKTTEMKAICNHAIRDTHIYIDQSVLVISNHTRYALHRIMMECSEMVENDFHIPERWDDVNESVDPWEVSFLEFKDRNDFLENTSDTYPSELYLSDEIDLAGRLGFVDCVEPTAAQWKNLDRIKDLTGFGYLPTSGIEITPKMVSIDLIVSKLRDVFRDAFPNTFG